MSVLVGELVEYPGPMSGREEGDSVSSSYVGGGVGYPGIQGIHVGSIQVHVVRRGLGRG